MRDELLGIEPRDIDIEVHGVPAEKLLTVLQAIGTVNTVGESFTVYKIDGIDVSLPRRDTKTGTGHRGFTVTGDPWMGIEEASRRRDFTINAIGRDTLTGEYLDPFNGRKDLRHRRLRAVDERTFGEDSLRVLRAVQLCARFGFTTDPGTIDLCRRTPLDDLPRERILGEIEKLLLKAKTPSRGLALALETHVIKRLFPELHNLVGCPQDPEWHPEGDVWTHTLMVVDDAGRLADDLERPRRMALMLGALCHDLGKPTTTATVDGRTRAQGHEAAGIPPTAAFLDRLGVWTMDGYDVRKQTLALVADHLAPAVWYAQRQRVKDRAFRRLARKVELDLLARLAEADCRGRGTTEDCGAKSRWFMERARSLDIERDGPEPILMGRHLIEIGVRPGPEMGRILKTVYEMQLDGNVDTLAEAATRARTLI